MAAWRRFGAFLILAIGFSCIAVTADSADSADARLADAERLAASSPRQALALLSALPAPLSPEQQQRKARLACEAHLDLGQAGQALEVTGSRPTAPMNPQRIAILLCRGAAYMRLGELAPALVELNAAEQGARSVGDQASLVSVLLKIADLYILQNRQDAAFRVLEEAYALAGSHALPALRQNALNSLALVYYNSGRHELAERYYRELVGIAESDGKKEDLAIALFNLGHALASQEKFHQADAAFERSRTLSELLEDQLGVAFTLKASAESAQAQGRTDLAEQLFGRALTIFKQANEEKQYASTLRHLGDVAQLRGDYELAVSRYQEAAPILKAHQFRLALTRTYRGLSEAYGMLGQFEQAYRYHRAYAILMQDSLEQQNEQSTKRMQAQFETQRLADQNRHLELQSLRQQEQISYDRRQKMSLAVVLVLGMLALGLALLLWRRSRQYARRMEQLATVDELTGIRNRRAVLRDGEGEWQRALRFQRPLSCLLFDIDHFKSVNDTYGHAVGDVVLQQVVKDVRGAVRVTDLFGRFGGEEFLVIAPETGVEQAALLAERIRGAVAATVYASMPGRQVTVSIGVAQVQAGSDLQACIQQADEALYRAKRLGRNQVQSAGTDTVNPQPACARQA